VDDNRQIKPGGHFELVNKKFDLASPVTIFMEIVQTNLAQGDYPWELDRFLDRRLPIPTWIGYLRRGDTYGMEDMFCGFEVFVHLFEINKAVANADDPPDAGLLRLLANKELFDRVIVYKPDVGMSVKIPHLSSV
jgi:hypothetical protein